MSNKNSDKEQWKCEHNEGVMCHERNCEKCGWNPTVAAARLESICNGHGVRVPETSE